MTENWPDKLETLRRNRGLRKAQMARAIGIQPRQYTRLINGETKEPSEQTRERIRKLEIAPATTAQPGESAIRELAGQVAALTARVAALEEMLAERHNKAG